MLKNSGRSSPGLMYICPLCVNKFKSLSVRGATPFLGRGLLCLNLLIRQAEQVQQNQNAQPSSMEFPSKNAPAVKSGSDFQLPEGNQWRYSEFINAVQAGKVERVRFSKDGSILQV